MKSSTDLMLTGSSMMPSVQAASHGAGQTRPVNSGKLLVSRSRWNAWCQSPALTRAFHSGMTLPSGQPERLVTDWWQKGVPQSMQRAACVLTCFSSLCSYTSRKSPARSPALRFLISAREYLMKPRSPFRADSSSIFSRLPRLAERSSMSIVGILKAFFGAPFFISCALGWLSPPAGPSGSRLLKAAEAARPLSPASRAFRKSRGKTRTNSGRACGQRLRICSAALLPVRRW
mmetsp:Transcript_107142/g.333972  ORF Transcript_107142/g.333972 Transcript_107142/m.333972 type:complete len:232 (+) Transcript_107142:122-817(+)